ncbi:MAG: hypothetical protein AAFY76_14595 [Cyanobacteria bacterium J06649_11]
MPNALKLLKALLSDRKAAFATTSKKIGFLLKHEYLVMKPQKTGFLTMVQDVSFM